MTVNPLAAAKAYASAARALSPAAPAAISAPAGATDFAALVSSAIESATGAGQAFEAKALGLANGKTEMVDLVTAVAETELAVETLVTVRDRVIAAYQDILNMPI